jgi:hypothetical protein
MAQHQGDTRPNLAGDIFDPLLLWPGLGPKYHASHMPSPRSGTSLYAAEILRPDIIITAIVVVVWQPFPRLHLDPFKMAAQADADFLNEPRFNRTFEYIPSGSTSGALKIKYADYGYRNEAHPEQERIMLFSGPLMGSRLVLATKDSLAIKHKIRIISADRPGMGGTDPVAPKDRLTIWRGTSSLPLC